MTATAKVLRTDGTQVICVPKSFNIMTDEVVISGNLDCFIVTPKPVVHSSWKSTIEGVFGACADFEVERTNDTPRGVIL